MHCSSDNNETLFLSFALDSLARLSPRHAPRHCGTVTLAGAPSSRLASAFAFVWHAHAHTRALIRRTPKDCQAS